MEMLTEFVSRHTYDKLLDILKPGTKPKFQEQLIEKSEGYQIFVERFRYTLKTFNIDEKKVLKELETILFEDTQGDLVKSLADWLGSKVPLTDVERYTIIDLWVDLRVSNEEFRKEVIRHYELVKRRQRRDNG
jgi:hypothetical protein